ncbi:MAG: TRAM domain-containing protein, partial [Planctomycetes bacterium]|nr:TRAM domain-containing protein [Planctomycetota bacterium]
RLMEEVRYQGAFIFKYSVRPGTRAAQWEDDVPVETKRERNQILLELQKRISLEIHRQAVGQVEEVLVDGPSKLDPERWSGRNRRHQIVVFPVRPGEDLAGKMGPVRIAEATALTLIGERCGEFA